MNMMKATTLISLLIASVAASAAIPEIDPNTLSESRISITDLSKPASPGKTYLAATIINAPVPKLCSIVLNYSDYPSFMPNTDKARIVQSSDVTSLVDMTLKLPLGKIKRYRLKMEAKTTSASCRLAWKLVPQAELKPEETIADTSGYWEMLPHPADKTRTVVKYFVYSDPGPVPMGLGWMVDALGKESLPKTLEALRGKARAM